MTLQVDKVKYGLCIDIFNAGNCIGQDNAAAKPLPPAS
jgi:hypothetical protein